MPLDNANTTELVGRYAVPLHSFESLVSELQTAISAFLGDDQRADGSATWNGPPNKTKRFPSLAEWAASSARSPSFSSIYLYANQSERRVSIYQDAHIVEVKVSARDMDVDAAQAALRQLETVLQLEVIEEISDRDRASTDREYLFVKPADPSVLLRVLQEADDISGPGSRTQIGIRMRDNAALQLRRVDDPRLRDVLGAQWNDVTGVDCSIHANRVLLRVEFRLAESVLFVHVEAADADKAKAQLARLEQVGALEVLPPTSAFKGRKKLFVPTGALDRQWFARAVGALSKAVPQVGYTNCAYRLVDAPTEEVVNRDYQQWSKDVLEQWERLALAYCWLDGRATRASMRIDPRREQVELSIESTTEARADAIMAALVVDLALAVARDASPNRRTAASFQVTRWGNKPFAQALEAALERVFGERPPAIEEAYIEELVGDAVDRRTITDLATLFARLRTSEPFGGVGLRTVARDDAIAVYVTPPKTRDGLHTIEIKSSYDAKEFPDLVKIFKRPLGLEPLPTSGDAEPAPGSSRADKRFDWRPVILSAVVGGAFTSAFWLAIIPTTSLEITVPAHVGDSDVTMPPGLDSVRVEWVIKRTQFSQTKILPDVEANIRVLRVSGQAVHETSARGKVTVPVVTGPQVIEVKTPGSSERAVLRIVVPPVAAPPPTRAP